MSLRDAFFVTSDDDDEFFECAPPPPHPQRAQVDSEKLRLRNAIAYGEALCCIPRDRPHARAVIKGIFGEAVRTARTREGFEEAPWREAMASALEELDTFLENQKPSVMISQWMMTKIQSKISSMDLFSSDRAVVGQYGAVHDKLQDMFHRKRMLLADM